MRLKNKKHYLGKPQGAFVFCMQVTNPCGFVVPYVNACVCICDGCVGRRARTFSTDLCSLKWEVHVGFVWRCDGS